LHKDKQISSLFKNKNIFHRNDKPTRGKILLSEPFMLDPNFRRSVILLCQHDKEGSFGFILNRQLDLKLSDVLPEYAYFQAPIYYGGPVEPDTLNYLHNLGDELKNSEKIADGVYWGGSFETLKILLAQQKVEPHQIRFFLGYSGWGEHQIEEELDQNSWIVTQSQSSDIFNPDQEKLWGNILKDMGGDYRSIASYPENPDWN